MLTWIQANIGSVAVAAGLLFIICLIVYKLINDKKAGKHACGGSCGSCECCPMHEKCHRK